MESPIKTLATKDDITNVRDEIAKSSANLEEKIANVRYDLSKDIGESKADTIKWMFIFWIGQVGATPAILSLFVKK